MFQTQVGYDINTARLLRNILHDNTAIIDRISDENIDHFITWLKKQKNYNFIEFLSVLCVCEERAMPENQTSILKKLLQAHKEDGVLLGTKVQDGEIYCHAHNSTTWVPIEEFLKVETVRAPLPSFCLSPGSKTGLFFPNRISSSSNPSCSSSPTSAMEGTRRTLRSCPVWYPRS